MANEALNSFQQFRDDGNHILARGSVKFYTDSGIGTEKDVYSDSDLTALYAQPFTYELDDYGRIRGDAHYDGTASLVITNAAGLEIRQLDDVVSTSDGNTGSITKQYESVAAMVTDESLAAGDVTATQGYYSGNNYGGARYVIVAAGTGTNDNYLFIGLGNGLQAQLLNLEQNKNFLVAGARGDGGSDDTNPMQAVINLGGDIDVPGGFIFVASSLELTARMYVFVGSGTMRQDNGQAADLFQITDADVALVKFRGVTLDGNQANGNQANSTVGWVIS